MDEHDSTVTVQSTKPCEMDGIRVHSKQQESEGSVGGGALDQMVTGPAGGEQSSGGGWWRMVPRRCRAGEGKAVAQGGSPGRGERGGADGEAQGGRIRRRRAGDGGGRR